MCAVSLTTARAEITRARAAQDAEAYGHPRAVFNLVISEGFERFAYFGVQSLLALYLVNRLLTPEAMDEAAGLSWLISALRSGGWSYSPQQFASAVFGVYGGLVYIAPALGGLVADRLLGGIATVRLAAISSALGCFLIASETLFFPGLLCVALGAGCFKSNVASQVSGLYAPGDGRREPAFQLFFIAINVGVIVAPLVCGWVGTAYGWSYAFALAGVGMLAGLAVYVAGEPFLPAKRRDIVAARAPEERPRLERRRLLGMLALALPISLIVLGNQQIYNAYLVWAEDAVDLSIGPFAVPTAWLVSFDTICSLAIMMVGFKLQAMRGYRVGKADALTKISLGGFIVALSYVALFGASLTSPAPGQTNFGWLLAFHLLSGLGFAYVIPTSLALFAQLAPAKFPASTLGLYYLQYALSNLAAGALGGLLSSMAATDFWAMHALLIAASAAAIALGAPLLRRAFAD